MNNVQSFETIHLRFRPSRISDVDLMASWRGEPEVVRFVSHGPLDRAGIAARLQAKVNYATASTSAQFNHTWAVLYTDENTGREHLIGEASAWTSANPPIPDGDREPGEATIGYVLDPAFQGKGLGTETAAALVSWLRDQGGITRVLATVFDENAASARILEKLGFTARDHVSAEQDATGKGLASTTYSLELGLLPEGSR